MFVFCNLANTVRSLLEDTELCALNDGLLEGVFVFPFRRSLFFDPRFAVRFVATFVRHFDHNQAYVQQAVDDVFTAVTFAEERQDALWPNQVVLPGTNLVWSRPEVVRLFPSVDNWIKAKDSLTSIELRSVIERCPNNVVV